jgi:hypothetical protein
MRFFIAAMVTGVLAIACPLTDAARVPSATTTATTTPETPRTYRLEDGITAYVDNSRGEKFDLDLDIRDLNLFADGPRELLVKVYDPDGRVVVRQVIADDGVSGGGYLPPQGGWDHALWYQTLNYARGSAPMVRFSAFSDPARLKLLAARRFHYSIPASQAGIYRIMVVGVDDHYVTIHLSPKLKYAVCGHPMWLHGSGDMFKRSYIYVPKGTTGLHLGFVEPDRPQTRRFTLTAPDGARLFDGAAEGGFVEKSIAFPSPRQYDDKLLILDVSSGSGDYLLHLTLINDFAQGDEHDEYFAKYGRGRGPAAVLAPDEQTARAAHAGAIEHDGQVFWHMFQVRLYDWIKKLSPDDFVVNDASGRVCNVVRLPGTQGWDLDGLPKRDGFVPFVARIVAPPLCDRIMFSYPLHHNRQALNLALREIASSLRSISTGDYMSVPGFNGNAGYIYAYAWQYWRPAWRIQRQSDAPADVKVMLREAFILCGDRIAFARSQERVNGNVFSKIPTALRYCYEATGDPLQKELFETYFSRFISEGWGLRTGIGPSGDCQEHFAHDALYGVLILEDFRAPIADFSDERFARVQQRVADFYSYTWCPDAQNAAPWGSRTSWRVEPSDVRSFIHWKGEPGPDFTTSVNGGNEWFAARRANYYALTFHGRLCPLSLCSHFGNTRLGYGGGMLCHVSVPGKGAILASTLDGDYGEHMEPHNWRHFHLHSIVGRLTDDRPLISADCESPDARLDGTTVTSSGEIRGCPAHVRRRYDFQPDRIACEARLGPSIYANQLQWPEKQPPVAEAYEMIPFIRGSKVSIDLQGGSVAIELTDQPQQTRSIVVDRGGFGMKIELDHVRAVQRGVNDTILIRLIDKPTPPENIAVKYQLEPFSAR